MDGEYLKLEMVGGSDGSVWGYSATLSLELRWEEGRLRFYDPVEERWLENMEETGVARETAEARAESAEARAAELEAELRRLRGE